MIHKSSTGSGGFLIVQVPTEACWKVISDLGLGGGFARWVHWFPPSLRTG